MEENTCKTCIYRKAQSGTCHKLPPLSVVVPVPNKISGDTTYQLAAVFPPTHEDAWCGSYELSMKKDATGRKVDFFALEKGSHNLTHN